jgi:hypothetical protein
MPLCSSAVTTSPAAAGSSPEYSSAIEGVVATRPMPNTAAAMAARLRRAIKRRRASSSPQKLPIRSITVPPPHARRPAKTASPTRAPSPGET